MATSLKTQARALKLEKANTNDRVCCAITADPMANRAAAQASESGSAVWCDLLDLPLLFPQKIKIASPKILGSTIPERLRL